MSQENVSSKQENNVRRSAWLPFRKTRIRLASLLCHLQFLTKCDSTNIIPPAFTIKSNRFKGRCKALILNFQRKLLRTAIRELRCKIAMLELKCYNMYQNLASETNQPLAVNKYMILIHQSVTSTTEILKKRHAKKLEWLSLKYNAANGNTSPPTENKQKSYVNLTSTNIPENLIQNIQHGPKFVPESKLNFPHTISLIEAALENTKPTDKHFIRSKVANTFIKHTQQPNQKINTSVTKLKLFAQQHNQMICKADKSGSLVFCDKSDIDQKVHSFLQETNCKILSQNPIPPFQSAIIKLSKKPELKNFIGNFTPPADSNIPRLFVQIKLHKPGHPIRPLVQNSKSPASNLEKLLAAKVRHLVDASPSKINSSKEFIQKVPVDLMDEDLIFTLDINSLFPSVPLFEAHMLMMKKFINSTDPPPLLIRSLYDCLHTLRKYTVFSYNNKYYQQQQGLPMGSPMSPVLAEVYLQHIEENIVFNHSKKPKCWFRYVDDIFVIWPHTKNDLLVLLNKITSNFPTIAFSINDPDENNIQFLDVLINRAQNKLSFEVYHKPSSPPNVIPSNSFSPASHKFAAFKSYIHRAHTICSTKHALQKEFTWIFNVAKTHGYNEKVISKLIAQYHHKKLTDILNPTTDSSKIIGSLPYFGQHTYSITKAFKKYGYKLAILPNPNNFQLLRIDKDPAIPLSSAGVYQIPIIDDNQQQNYIGSTYRRIDTRLKEHQADLKCGRNTTALTQYLLENPKAFPDWKNSKMLAHHPKNRLALKYSEAFTIISTNNINIDLPRYIPFIWKSLLITYEPNIILKEMATQHLCLQSDD